MGSTILSSAIDFEDAGTAGIGGSRYMKPPKVNSTSRGNLSGVTSGDIIYNTTANKLQVYVGTGAYNVANWQNLH